MRSDTPIRDLFKYRPGPKVATLIELFLHRRATAADLADLDVDRFEMWLRLQYSAGTIRSFLDALKAVLRRLAIIPKRIKPLKGKPTRPLSDADGTLWGICLKQYFPVNVRIRSNSTRAHYRTSIADLKAIVGHEPTPADLTDENIGRVMAKLIADGRTPVYANTRRQKLRALWEWLARKRMTAEFPTIRKLKEPKRIPQAWTLEQLAALMAACRSAHGQIAPGIAAADFWVALHCVAWDSAERIGALLALRWEMLDGSTLIVPYTIRKGGEADARYVLRQETLDALDKLRPAGHALIFPFPKRTFYHRYGNILRRAGLPADRKSKMHRMRRSVASHLTRLGHDACAALGHSSPAVTAVYLDPAITGKAVEPAKVLPQIA